MGDGKANIDVLVEIANTVKEMVEMGYRVVAVVGGGVAARQYIAAAAALGANPGTKDMMGMALRNIDKFLLLFSALLCSRLPLPVLQEFSCPG